MRFPASYTFDTKLRRGNETIRATVYGYYEDDWQYLIESVEDESGADITNELTSGEIADLESKGSLEYGEYLICRAETARERMEDR